MQKKLFVVLTLIFSICLNAQDNNRSAVVLELFTSQGCSSCPPADELLDEIRDQYQDQHVYVLSYHVNYWNRLGWKDPFSTEAFTDYQRDYAIRFNSRSIYTPQLVVNGSEHFTGSNRFKADNALKRYASSKASNSIILEDVKKEEGKIHVKYQVDGDNFDRITLALVVAERITHIARGENRNRKLKNSNIVASRMVHTEDSGQIALAIPDWVTTQDELWIIAYTQDGALKTTGASKVGIY